MIDIRLAEKSDRQKWDDFVLSQHSSGPYQLFAWKEAIESAYYHKSFYLMAEDEKGMARGVFPLVHVKAPFLKGVLISLPFCDYGGPLAVDDHVRQVLVEKALELSKTMKIPLEIRCIAGEPRIAASELFGVKTHKSRMLLSLPGSSDILWDGFKSKLRSQIRRALKEGMEFRIGGASLVEDFYRVICRNMRDLGSPVHSRSWFASVIDAYGDRARVGVVYKDNVPIGSGIILCCGNSVTIPWASTLREYNALSPNMLLYWEFLKYASDNGYQSFDFGRSTPGEGTFKFKQQWGAEPFPLYWYGDSADTETMEDSAGPLRAYAEKVWSRIPQVLTDKMGPLVRRFITL